MEKQYSNAETLAANPPFYTIEGKRYFPLKDVKNFSETGIASWYGKPFHGRKTSNGEIYNMHELTAAHPTLPLPIFVEVTNLNNGKRVTVRVNDRGPFKKNRIIDLSHAAAEKLGFLQEGTTRVKIRTVSPFPDTKSLTYFQIGAFSQIENARQLMSKIRDLPTASSNIVRIQSKNKTLYKLHIGPIEDNHQAKTVADYLDKQGIPSIFVNISPSTN